MYYVTRTNQSASLAVQTQQRGLLLLAPAGRSRELFMRGLPREGLDGVPSSRRLRPPRSPLLLLLVGLSRAERRCCCYCCSKLAMLTYQRASRPLSINLIPPTIFNDSSSSDNTNNNYDQYNSTFPRAFAQERAGERVGDITYMGTIQGHGLFSPSVYD